MTQVLSVSATTAAYALEAQKPVQRVSRKSEVEHAIEELARKAETGDDFQLRGLMTAVRPPALTLYFLTAASQRQEPQTTLSEAVEAYDDNSGNKNPESDEPNRDIAEIL